ncbi:stage III sporulation protein AH [Paenibacillus algorifonticola]|uniref:Stage III sporulation protein AH n=1 Tax=Paenibacillus algorifonticola TaxID=684063 RepID=A0A1I2ELF2_9BACL|nr:SpoIIIAH-like family protein [Paenibacillus algorifonticola]SFE93201.1 stage III sporulation protein AH [Paenibacillus algorifonticola]
MNTKRQTIWLVSMLSLMVVLSAYYLFTQDASSPELLTDNSQLEQTVGQGATEAAGSGIVVDEVQQGADNGVSEADKEVLEQYEQGSPATSVFADIQEKRTQENNEELDKLMADIANTQVDKEKSTEAAKQLSLLEEKNVKLTELEEQLMQNYESAIVDEENNVYKVVVASEKLEKNQAADIVDLVMKKMEINADQVSVQFVP